MNPIVFRPNKKVLQAFDRERAARPGVSITFLCNELMECAFERKRSKRAPEQSEKQEAA